MGKIRFNISKDGIRFTKGKGRLSKPMEKKNVLYKTCGKRHPINDGGFEYLDCMNYLKKISSGNG